MIVCTECGNQNEDGAEFCGSCGAFLDWTGEKIEEPKPAPSPVREPEAEVEGRPRFIERVKTAVGLEAPPSQPDGGDGDELPPAVESAEAALPQAPPVESEVEQETRQEARSKDSSEALEQSVADGNSQAAGLDAAQRAAALVAKAPKPVSPREEATVETPSVTDSVAPVAPVAPMPAPDSAPAPRTPQEAMAHAAPKLAPVPKRSIKPGDLVCGQCGEANEPSRRFCRKCGALLVEEAPQTPLPWWRRLFKRLVTRKPKQALRAGERPWRKRR